MKKKIMHVAQSAGGVSRYLKSFLKYSDKNKYEIILVVSKDYLNELCDFKDLADIIKVVHMERNIKFKNDLLCIYEVYKLYRDFLPDIVYCHSSKAGAITRLALMFSRVPIVYNAHGWAFNMKAPKLKLKIYSLIERFLALRTNLIINISDYEQITAQKQKIKCNMKRIYNGIDLNEESEFQESIDLRENLKINKTSKIIGVVGRLSKQKSPFTFVKVAERLANQDQNTHFLWVGDGEQREEIENLVDSIPALRSRFTITGWVNDPISYIKLFDIALLLSKWEGFGLVLTEYMSLRKPIVATNIDAIPEIVTNNECGFLVNVDSIEEFCDSITQLLSNDELVEKFITNGYLKVNEVFNIKRVVEEHEIIFSEILSNKESICKS